jgi:hypothetical protein
MRRTVAVARGHMDERRDTERDGWISACRSLEAMGGTEDETTRRLLWRNAVKLAAKDRETRRLGEPLRASLHAPLVGMARDGVL